MISFSIITEDSCENIIRKFSEELSEDAADCFAELVYGLDLSLDGVEFAVAVSCGCALVRVFDMGRYLFLFPCALDEKADVKAALDAIAEYSMREEIPFVLTDVLLEELPYLSGYRHMDIDAEDETASSYRVRIKTECELNDEIPRVVMERVELNALNKEDISLYAELCMNENVNKYWGYNYLEDVSEPTPEYFYENAEREFSLGIAVTMAIRVTGEFAGESTIYAFDGRGGAEFAIRLLPNWHGNGIGSEASRATVEAARALGLVKLRAEIMRDNASSIGMLKKLTDSFVEKDNSILFEIIL